MLTNGGEARVLGENSPLALALPKALGRAIVSESETRSDCIKSSLVVMISVTCTDRTDRSNESGQESRGIFAAGSTEAPDFFSRTADGAPLRAIEARVCSPCAPSPPACAPRSLAGWQAAKTAWAELHQPRRTARTSSADRGRQWRATGSSQPRDGAHSAGVGRSPRHGGARQLPSQDSLRLNCRSRF